MTNSRDEDHRRQMRNERPEAICPRSDTERHQWTIRYDQLGRLVTPDNPDGIRRCEACDAAIRQEGSRWVAIPHVELARWQQMPRLIIDEEEHIEDVL